MASQARLASHSQETVVWPKDALHYHTDFPLKAAHYPLGFPLELSTNSNEVLSAAEESWGPFPKLHSADPIHLRIGVSNINLDQLPTPPTFRAQRNLISIVADAHNFAVCDVTAGFAFSWITRATAAHTDFFRYHFLEVMAGLLLTPLHHAIIHGACVALDGHGVLLCGHSGAGKSTLAFACAKKGWTFLSDDAGFVLRKHAGRAVTGNPLWLRLRENSHKLFPELSGRPVMRRQNGELGFEISTSTLPRFAIAFSCEIDHVIFLDRHRTGPACLSSLPKDEAFRLLNDVLDYTLASRYPVDIWPQPDMVLADPTAREEQRAAVRNLLKGGLYRMRYANLDTAIDCLEALVRRGTPTNGTKHSNLSC